MWIPCRQRRILSRMARSLRRSDPHLATMLAIFARLTAGEAVDSREQGGAAGEWVRRGLARLGRAMAVTAACLGACARRALRAVRYARMAVRRRFSASARKAAGFPPPAGKPGEPRWPS